MTYLAYLKIFSWKLSDCEPCGNEPKRTEFPEYNCSKEKKKSKKLNHIAEEAKPFGRLIQVCLILTYPNLILSNLILTNLT
jgi:hypothetical protein